MAENIFTEQFEADRRRLRAVAFRMLGNAAEAEDAVQETWLRLSRTDMSAVGNLGGWLTTVVARVCLDMLRSRRSRREEPLEPETDAEDLNSDPETDLAMADSVGLALMVVLDRLTPAERLAFVLHDLFDLPFEEVAPIVGRSVEAARQLASRARRRVQGADAPEKRDEKRRIVDAFLTASRTGDMAGLLTLLDPQVVMRADPAAMKLGDRAELRGAAEVAGFFSGKAQSARTALLDGVVGVTVAPAGKLLLVLEIRVSGGRITGIDAVADPDRLRMMDIQDVT